MAHAARLLHCATRCALLIAGLAIAWPAIAQDWPARNVTIIVPIGAGSATDIMVRVVADQLGKQLNRTFVVENRTGAGGTIGAGMAARSAPDGYTILAYGALATAHALYNKLPYDTLNDFVPVIPFGEQRQLVTVSPTGLYKTLGDLIAAGKTKPGALNYSTVGFGSASHFSALRIIVAAGIEAQPIPVKGAGEAATEVMAGRVDFSVQTSTSTLGLVREGQLRALAVSAHKRVEALPDVPTVIEAGLRPEAVSVFYSGLYLPARTPREIVEKLHRETQIALESAPVRVRFATLGVDPLPMTLAEFAAFFREDVAASVALVQAAKLPKQ
jgi:tripartite-type tricarboxylate transporter receptor subunit TctC